MYTVKQLITKFDSHSSNKDIFAKKKFNFGRNMTNFSEKRQ